MQSSHSGFCNARRREPITRGATSLDDDPKTKSIAMRRGCEKGLRVWRRIAQRFVQGDRLPIKGSKLVRRVKIGRSATWKIYTMGFLEEVGKEE